MDVLVSMGTNASYFYSVISILHHHFAEHHVSMAYQPTDFFETSAMLITLVLFGKYLESAVSQSSSPVRLAAAAAEAASCGGQPSVSCKVPFVDLGGGEAPVWVKGLTRSYQP